jgi:ABC-type branched-subunit amino acid transport system substrate-binding protein
MKYGYKMLLAIGAMLASSAQAQEIRLGMSAPLTGPRAVAAKELRSGIEAAFRQANAAGGVNGRQVTLDVKDDGGQPPRTLENTRAFAADPRVVALTGYVGAEPIQGALRTIDAGRLPVVGVLSGAESLRQDDTRNVFHVRAGHAQEAAAIVAQLDHMGIEQIGILHQDDSLGRDGLDGATAELSRLAIRPTAVVRIDVQGKDADRAAKEMSVTPAGAVIVIANDRATSAFVRAMKVAGQNPRYLSVSDADGESLVRSLGPLARGFGVSQVVPLPTSAVRQVVRDYQAAMQATGQQTFTHQSLEGYLYGRVALEALRRAGRDVSRDRVTQVLESLDVDLGGFRVRFGGRSRQGSVFTEMTVVRHDGRLAR